MQQFFEPAKAGNSIGIMRNVLHFRLRTQWWITAGFHSLIAVRSIALMAIAAMLGISLTGCEQAVDQSQASKPAQVRDKSPVLPPADSKPAVDSGAIAVDQSAGVAPPVAESTSAAATKPPPETASANTVGEAGSEAIQDPETAYVEPVFPQELVNPKWIRMNPTAELWIDRENRRVVVGGRICFREGYLEMFACPAGTKEHESVVAANSSARLVHACLLALDANPGTTVSWDPEYKPATGPVIDIELHWIADGKEVKRKAQDMVLDMKTNQAMTQEWVFGGSRSFVETSTGEEFYAGDGGEFICLSNFTTATIDIPVPSSDSVNDLMFAANSENIPPLEHRVLMYLKPRVDPKKSDDAKADDPGKSGEPD